MVNMKVPRSVVSLSQHMKKLVCQTMDWWIDEKR